MKQTNQNQVFNQWSKNKNPLIKLFKKHRTIGVVGDTNSGKSSLILSLLLDLKRNYKMPIYCLGVESNLEPHLKGNGIQILQSKTDILDMKIKNSVIFIDEFSDLFSTRTQDKELNKLKRFLTRISHLNDFLIISTAQTGFWNKFICSLIKSYIVKQIEFQSLVNGTDLKTKIKNIKNTSDYRLEVSKDKYYIITDNDVVREYSSKYDPKLDSKKDLRNPFLRCPVLKIQSN